MRPESRSCSWYNRILLGGKLNDIDWKENFRMSNNTYNLICEKLRLALAPESNKLNVFWRQKEQMSVEKKVAIGVYYLASCCEYRIVANQFGVHKNTVCKVVHEFVNAVVNNLKNDKISQ